MSPIIGIRYKCAICKFFDFCINCEESCFHCEGLHPMLKIRKNGAAPVMMIFAMNEDEMSSECQR